MNMLKKQVGPEQRQGAAQALKESEDEGRQWPVDHDVEVKHEAEDEGDHEEQPWKKLQLRG